MPLTRAGEPLLPARPLSALDRYTVGMAASGALMGLNNFPLWLVAALGFAFQFTHTKASAFVPGSFVHPANESVLNDAVDLGAYFAAWYVMDRLPKDPALNALVTVPAADVAPTSDPPALQGTDVRGVLAWPNAG